MPRRVLLVLPTRSYRAEAFLAAATRQGFAVVVASESASTLSEFMRGRELVLDLGSPEASLGRALALHAEHPLDAVIGVDESAVLPAAQIAAALGLRHHSVDGVSATRDKRRLRALLAGAGLPQPGFAELHTGSSREDIAAAAAAVGAYPVVVKPVDLSAGQGVIRADGPAPLVAAVARIGRMLEAMGCGPSGAQPLLLERFVPGQEVAVEALVTASEVRVLAIFDKPDPLDGPFFEETILVTPSRRPPATQAALMALTASACRALGLSHGPVHAELRLPPAGPVVIEVAARSIGGMCSRTLRFGEAGLSLEEVILINACGLPLPDLSRPPGASAVCMLPIPHAGRLIAVDGAPVARAIPWVESVSIAVPAGAELVPLPEGDRYLGFVFAAAPTPVEAEHAVRAAQRTLRVIID